MEGARIFQPGAVDVSVPLEDQLAPLLQLLSPDCSYTLQLRELATRDTQSHREFSDGSYLWLCGR